MNSCNACGSKKDVKIVEIGDIKDEDYSVFGQWCDVCLPKVIRSFNRINNKRKKKV